MRIISITTIISFLLFSILTISHALYVFTDLTHLSDVDLDADDDYRGPPKILLPSAIGGARPTTKEACIHERHTTMRLFPRQCRQNGRAKSEMVEANFNAAEALFGSGARGRGQVAKRYAGADVEGREEVMMLMFKRPHNMIPHQRAHQQQQQKQENQNGNDVVSKSEEEKRNEQVKEADSFVMKRIRKFMSNI